MGRAHLYLPIASAAGDVLEGITVRLLDPGTTTPIAETIYSGPSGSGSYAPPFVVSTGVLDFYLDAPRRVRIGVTPPGQAEFFLEDVDVNPDSTLVVYGTGAMKITNAPGGANWLLKSINATTAQWVAP